MLKKKNVTKSSKQKKTINVSIRKGFISFLWLLFISGFAFAVYKNFTAIDMHTVHEKEIVQERVVSTQAVENFVESFAKVFYSWEQTQEPQDKRINDLKQYTTDEVINLNSDMVRGDIPTRCVLEDFSIYGVEQINDNEYCVTFQTRQRVYEGDTNTGITRAAYTIVHIDNNGDMVIIKSPTITALPELSPYIPPVKEYDTNISSNTSNEVKGFLETFFRLYPKASQEELTYYVKDGLLRPVNNNYLFSELTNTYISSGENNTINVVTAVKYIDNVTKTTLTNEFNLTLQKIDDNYKIIGVNK